MNNIIWRNIIRFVLIYIFQVFVLKRMSAGWAGDYYLNVIIYPLFLMMLPLRTPRTLLLVIGFLAGILIDIFYESYGIHASAAVFITFFRPYLLNWLAPREGYNVNQSPTMKQLGLAWFSRYAAIMLLAYLIVYFAVDAFTFVYYIDIIKKTIFGFLASYFFLMAVVLIFNPKE